MSLALPTSEDVDVLVSYVRRQLRTHAAASAAGGKKPTQPEREASSDDEDVDDHQFDDATDALASTCHAIVEIIGASTNFFSPQDGSGGPVVDPARFLGSRMPQLVDLHDRAQQCSSALLAEGREHGLNFAPEDTRRCYLRFSEGIASVERWTMVGLRLCEGRGGEGRRSSSSSSEVAQQTAAVDVHDVSSVYTAFHENSQLFFLQECTLYDPRIQRRLLMPAYFTALRDHIHSLEKEVIRLHSIDTMLHEAKKTFKFHPSLSEFQFLLESLQLYLATSIIEDELTTVTYYKILLESVQKETKSIAVRLSNLPQPPPPPLTGELVRATGAPAAENDPTTNALSEPDQNNVEAALAAFDEVRHRTLELQSNLRRDIETKNKSHRTRIGATPASGAAATPTAPAAPAAGSNGEGWWASLKTASERLFIGAVDVVTCKAELFPAADRDSTGFLLSRVSPLVNQKLKLLEQVNLLADAVEAIADEMEKRYHGVYHRDWVSRLQQSAGRVMRKLETMSVVFKSSH